MNCCSHLMKWLCSSIEFVHLILWDKSVSDCSMSQCEYSNWFASFHSSLQNQLISKKDVDEFISKINEITNSNDHFFCEQKNKEYTTKFLTIDLPKIISTILKSKPSTHQIYTLFGRILESIIPLILCLLETHGIQKFYDTAIYIYFDKRQPIYQTKFDLDIFQTSKLYKQIIKS